MLESWIIPVVICVALVVIIGLLFRKTKRGNGEFDERQELLRAGAHKHAFYTILILAALHGFLVSVLERPIMEDGVSSMLLIFVGIGVFAVDCVMHDAFFRVRQRPGLYLLICAACVLSNITGAIGYLRSGSMIRDGLLTMSCLPLVVGVVFLAVFLAIVWKACIKKEAEEE